MAVDDDMIIPFKVGCRWISRGRLPASVTLHARPTDACVSVLSSTCDRAGKQLDPFLSCVLIARTSDGSRPPLGAGCRSDVTGRRHREPQVAHRHQWRRPKAKQKAAYRIDAAPPDTPAAREILPPACLPEQAREHLLSPPVSKCLSHEVADKHKPHRTRNASESVASIG